MTDKMLDDMTDDELDAHIKKRDELLKAEGLKTGISDCGAFVYNPDDVIAAIDRAKQAGRDEVLNGEPLSGWASGSVVAAMKTYQKRAYKAERELKEERNGNGFYQLQEKLAALSKEKNALEERCAAQGNLITKLEAEITTFKKGMYEQGKCPFCLFNEAIDNTEGIKKENARLREQIAVSRQLVTKLLDALEVGFSLPISRGFSSMTDERQYIMIEARLWTGFCGKAKKALSEGKEGK